MQWNKTYHRKKICVFFFCVLACAVILLGRLVYLMIFRGDYYSKLATDLQQRERQIKAARGKILDRNGVVLAGNKSVCTISVIHNQIEEPEKVIQMLCKELGISEEKVRKRVEKRSSIERIKSNVDKETGNRILAYGFAGVKVDEDYKREYPFDELGSKVLGFTGGDNQGIIGLETVYDEELQGTDGTILTTTDARGVEVDNIGEERVEPIAGNNLRLTLDANIQKFAEQAAQKAFIRKEADIEEICARIAAVWQRHASGKTNDSAGETVLRLSELTTFHTDSFTLRIGPNIIPLTGALGEVLVLLCRPPRQCRAATDICRQLWHNDSKSKITLLQNYISQLRKLLTADPALHIVSLYNKGYYLQINGE